MLQIYAKNIKVGRTTYLSPDEELLVVTAAEKEVPHELLIGNVKLVPLTPPGGDTNTQACLAADQTPKGGKQRKFN